MRLHKLDGFQRVNTRNITVNGRGRSTRRQAKKRGRSEFVKGQGSAAAGKEISRGATRAAARSESQIFETLKKPVVNRLKQSHKIKRAYGLGQIETQSTESAISQQLVDSGAEPSIGFSRVYVGNDPRGKGMQGFGRINYTNKELQGLSLQGFQILQGYAMGNADDLEDWNALLSIEHPDTLQGFPDWVLNGKKEREERQRKRRERRAAKKAQRQTAQTGRKEDRTTRKKKRKARTTAGKDRKQRRKEVRTARKEERLRLKSLKREERLKRKQQRLDDRKQRQLERQETKRLRQEARTQRRADRGETFREFGDSAFDTARTLFTGGGDFQDFSYNDFTPDQFPSGFDDQIERFRSGTGEDFLTYRDQEDIIIDEPFADEDDQYYLDPADAEDSAKKGNTIIPLAAAAAVAFAMSQKKGKKKRA